jgi:hypothetical protein
VDPSGALAPWRVRHPPSRQPVRLLRFPGKGTGTGPGKGTGTGPGKGTGTGSGMPACPGHPHFAGYRGAAARVVCACGGLHFVEEANGRESHWTIEARIPEATGTTARLRLDCTYCAVVSPARLACGMSRAKRAMPCSWSLDGKALCLFHPSVLQWLRTRQLTLVQTNPGPVLPASRRNSGFALRPGKPLTPATAL